MRFAAALLALAIAVPAGAAGPEPPLVAATKAGDTAAARNLIEHKADVNAKETAMGQTPLMFEAALMVALLGFVGTVALARYLSRGDVVE